MTIFFQHTVIIVNEVCMENNWNTQENWLLINTLLTHNSKQD